ncbi:flavin reductase family protein [Oricola sp.]|uniref:flavin reductase family protein n=1 Tax=Oricola sp. TaxID=1979950 RepID=UPI0025D33CDC|nr:flavin reductase family protein [Oricola sp.]MCI5075353.1 flavin reductase family protein [Oricola sp.]
MTISAVQTRLEPAELRDQRSFRDTLGRYPTGVVVIAAGAEDGPVGMTVNSFTSVSLDPPLIAFCPMRSSATWAQIKAAGGFAVSLLRLQHEVVARQFSQKGVDRFAGHEWWMSPTGHPVLAEAMGWLDAAIESVTSAGDHELVVARVLDWSAPGEGDPLVFFSGGYRALS